MKKFHQYFEDLQRQHMLRIVAEYIVYHDLDPMQVLIDCGLDEAELLEQINEASWGDAWQGLKRTWGDVKGAYQQHRDTAEKERLSREQEAEFKRRSNNLYYALSELLQNPQEVQSIHAYVMQKIQAPVQAEVVPEKQQAAQAQQTQQPVTAMPQAQAPAHQAWAAPQASPGYSTQWATR